MYIRTDNPIRDFERYDAEQQRKLDRLPKCDRCKDPIQGEDCYDFDGVIICSDCLDDYIEDNFKVRTPNYAE